MIGYLGVIIGGVIGILSALLTDVLRARRDEKRRKFESAHEFFRKLYNPLGPFFSVQYACIHQFKKMHKKFWRSSETVKLMSHIDPIGSVFPYGV